MLNQLISNIVPYMPQKLVWLFSKQYIAGKTIYNAVNAAKSLKARGIMTTVDLLGEFIIDLNEATANKQRYLAIIETIHKAGIDGNYSLKPTFFGLLINKEAAYGHLRQIIAKASQYGHFVRIDMEDSRCTDMEIELFRRLKTQFPENVGLALQVYLKRTLKDIENLKDLNNTDTPLNLRLCKGIYIEPATIAYHSYEQINANFLKAVELMFTEKMYPAIATHDKAVVEGVYKLIKKHEVPVDQYEFQMLYGVTPKLRSSILAKGHPMRVYIPFGKQWFEYCVRRIKENPKIGSVIIKALFCRG